MKNKKIVFFLIMLASTPFLYSIVVVVTEDASECSITFFGQNEQGKTCCKRLPKKGGFSLPFGKVFAVRVEDLEGKTAIHLFRNSSLPHTITIAKTGDGFPTIFPLTSIADREPGRFLAPEIRKETEEQPGCCGPLSLAASRLFSQRTAKEKTD